MSDFVKLETKWWHCKKHWVWASHQLFRGLALVIHIMDVFKVV